MKTKFIFSAILVLIITLSGCTTQTSGPEPQTGFAVLEGEGSGLIAHWDLNEGTGTTAKDSIGSYHATLIGNPPWIVSPTGNSISFNNISQYVALPATIPPLSNFTFSTWVNIDSIDGSPPNSAIFFVGDRNSFGLRSTSEYININGNVLQGVTTSSNIGGWIQFVVTRDSGSAKFYRNGELIGSWNGGNLPMKFALSRLGSSWTGYRLIGKMKDVRIYNRALTTNEVATLYDNALGNIDDSPPNISSIAATTVTYKDAKISWTTSENADTQVEYGTNTSYGYQTALNGTLTTTHTQTLTGLAPDTIYHFRVKSTDRAGNSATSTDQTFITTSLPPTNVTAATCNETDVNNAINLVKEGGIVNIPQGTCTWPTQLVITDKYFTLKGAGQDKTIIIDGVDKTIPNDYYRTMLRINTKPGGLTRITNLTFDGGTGPNDSYNRPMIELAGPSKTWRIDHVTFNARRSSSLQIYASGGVIDHSIFEQHGWFMAIYGKNGEGDNASISWSTPTDLGGSSTQFFIEDNNFIRRGSASPGVDGWRGERVVVRHNNFVNTHFSNHGTESSGILRGARSFEIYDNLFFMDQSLSGLPNVIDIRSGTGVIFNNKIDGKFTSGVHFNNYREWRSFPPFGQCDGTSPYDLNDKTGTYDPTDPGIFESGTVTEWKTVVNIYNAYVLTVSGKDWNTNQWRGYTVHNTTQPGYRSIIRSNDKNTLTVVYDNTFTSENVKFNPNDAFVIRHALLCLDQTAHGMGGVISGSPPTPAAYPNQLLEPIYVWGNTITGGDPHNGAQRMISNSTYYMTRNIDYFEDTPMPGYTPYTYPHPLTLLGDGEEPPENGQCGTLLNTCTVGTLNDLEDTTTQNIWQCIVSPPGSNATCTTPKTGALINGQCGASNNSCIAGTLSDISDSTTQYLWNCNGQNGGSNTACSLTKSAPIDGVCGAQTNTCTTGTFIDTQDSQTHNLWNCNGTGGGSNTSCSTLKQLTGLDSDGDGVDNAIDRCPKTKIAARPFVNQYGCAMPIATKFDIKPDFNSTDINGMQTLELGITQIGKISYTNQNITLTKTTTGQTGNEDDQLNIDADLNITTGKIEINTNQLPMLNKPATITLYNITAQNPIIKKDGATCTECTIISHDKQSGTLVFTVPGL